MERINGLFVSNNKHLAVTYTLSLNVNPAQNKHNNNTTTGSINFLVHSASKLSLVNYMKPVTI